MELIILTEHTHVAPVQTHRPRSGVSTEACGRPAAFKTLWS